MFPSSEASYLKTKT